MAANAISAAGQRNRVVGLICAGHTYSHFTVLALPPLFLMMKDDLGVGFAALGGLVTAYAIATAVAQTPVGMVVDRFGGRRALVLGLLVQGVALGLIGLTDSYWQVMALMTLAGLGNSVYHPADFAIMGARIDERHMGRAVGIHAFSGYLGFAIAPPTMLALASVAGWRGAMAVVGVVGVVIMALLMWQGGLLDDRGRGARGPERRHTLRQSFAVMGSGQMLALFFFYLLTTVSTAGVMALSAVAVIALYDADLVQANIGLTGFLVAASGGVLAGGMVADRSAHHNRVAAATLFVMAGSLLVIAFGVLDLWLVIGALTVAGFCYGLSTPSRDLLVRAVTPPGAIGTAFGFTSTGLSLGNGIGPVLCGWVMDHGRPDMVFVVIAAFTLVAVLTVVPLRSRGRPGSAARP